MATRIDHFKISVSDFEKSRRFYYSLFKFIGLKKVFESRDKNNAWGGDIVMFGPATKDWTFEIQEGSVKAKFNRGRAGLDHIAFTAPSKRKVDALYRFLKGRGETAFEPRKYPEYAKSYYACFFLDPDGIVLEYVYS